MRLFQRRRGDNSRNEFDEIKRVLRCLKSSPAHTRSGVGAGICLANTNFTRRFAGLQTFRHIPMEDRERFCSELSDLELGLRSEEPGMALGVGLYRIWLTELIDGRHEEAELLGKELTELSRNG